MIYAVRTVTDAPETTSSEPAASEPSSYGATADDDSVAATIEMWRADLANEGSVSATEVQDRLLDLWGRLPDGDARAGIERWLTETLERHLYQVADVDARLDAVLTAV